ncbi:hypothetical protein MKEN_01413800 [Mycena kentingensis (nom. inval.)]|nr:hypothetical protein MKEN_01413800 [Mycena kentingensis (nom. inval.)]
MPGPDRNSVARERRVAARNATPKPPETPTRTRKPTYDIQTLVAMSTLSDEDGPVPFEKLVEKVDALADGGNGSRQTAMVFRALRRSVQRKLIEHDKAEDAFTFTEMGKKKFGAAERALSISMPGMDRLTAVKIMVDSADKSSKKQLQDANIMLVDLVTDQATEIEKLQQQNREQRQPFTPQSPPRPLGKACSWAAGQTARPYQLETPQSLFRPPARNLIFARPQLPLTIPETPPSPTPRQVTFAEFDQVAEYDNGLPLGDGDEDEDEAETIAPKMAALKFSTSTSKLTVEYDKLQEKHTTVLDELAHTKAQCQKLKDDWELSESMLRTMGAEVERLHPFEELWRVVSGQKAAAERRIEELQVGNTEKEALMAKMERKIATLEAQNEAVGEQKMLILRNVLGIPCSKVALE